MIKAVELRIGNWIKKDGKVFKVAGINGALVTQVTDTYFDDYADHLSEFEPIPLTPELLEKCGFKNGKIRSGFTDMLVKEFSTVMQGIFKGEWCMMLSATVPYQLDHHFQYLHQLQNLYFALTGEELQVTLNS